MSPNTAFKAMARHRHFVLFHHALAADIAECRECTTHAGAADALEQWLADVAARLGTDRDVFFDRLADHLFGP